MTRRPGVLDVLGALGCDLFAGQAGDCVERHVDADRYGGGYDDFVVADNRSLPVTSVSGLRSSSSAASARMHFAESSTQQRSFWCFDRGQLAPPAAVVFAERYGRLGHAANRSRFAPPPWRPRLATIPSSDSCHDDAYATGPPNTGRGCDSCNAPHRAMGFPRCIRLGDRSNRCMVPGQDRVEAIL